LTTLPTGVPSGGICLRDAGRMHRRLTGEFGNCSHFHVMSRTTGGEMLFGDEEKEAFRLLMWRLAIGRGRILEIQRSTRSATPCYVWAVHDSEIVAGA
jgi:hypothetical protein